MHAGGQVDRRSVTESPVAVPIHKGDRIGADITCGAGIREGGIRVQRQCAVGRSGDGYERNRIPISVAACHDRTRHCECRTGRRVMPGKGILPCGDTTLAVNGPSRSHRCQNRSGVLHAGGQVNGGCVTLVAGTVSISEYDRIRSGVPRITGVSERGICVQRQCPVGGVRCSNQSDCVSIGIAAADDGAGNGERRTSGRVVAVQSKLQ